MRLDLIQDTLILGRCLSMFLVATIRLVILYENFGNLPLI